MNLVRNLFDSRIAVAEADLATLSFSDSDLQPVEAESVRNAVAKRRHEFIAGRVLARRALVALGLPAAPIPAGPDRAPLWPAGVVGSITHSREQCAVAVAHARDVRSIGVDLERATPASEKLWRRISTPAERSWLESLPASERGLAGKLLFCAKEACYKAQYPLTGQFLGFKALEIRVDRQAGIWRGIFQVPAGSAFQVGDVLEGTFTISDDHLATGVVIPR